MVSRTRPPPRVTSTRHSLAPEWRSTLVTPSRTAQASGSPRPRRGPAAPTARSPGCRPQPVRVRASRSSSARSGDDGAVDRVAQLRHRPATDVLDVGGVLRRRRRVGGHEPAHDGRLDDHDRQGVARGCRAGRARSARARAPRRRRRAPRGCGAARRRSTPGARRRRRPPRPAARRRPAPARSSRVAPSARASRPRPGRMPARPPAAAGVGRATAADIATSSHTRRPRRPGQRAGRRHDRRAPTTATAERRVGCGQLASTATTHGDGRGRHQRDVGDGGERAARQVEQHATEDHRHPDQHRGVPLHDVPVEAGRPSPHPVPGDVRTDHDGSRQHVEPARSRSVAKRRGLRAPSRSPEPGHSPGRPAGSAGATSCWRARRHEPRGAATCSKNTNRPPGRSTRHTSATACSGSARSTGRPSPARRRRYRLRAGSPRREREERCAPRHPGAAARRVAWCGSSPVHRTSGCSRPKLAPRPTPISSTCPRSPPTSSRLRRW